MTNPTTNNPTRETSRVGSRGPVSDVVAQKIQQLLTADASDSIGPEDSTQIEATEYNWHQPHYFNSEQLIKLDSFTGKIAPTIARKFADFCHRDFNVTVASTTQHFAGEFLEQRPESKQNDYYLAFGTAQPQAAQMQNDGFGLGAHLSGSANGLGLLRRCGVIIIPAQTAIIWVTQLLGDVELEKNTGKSLSQLEKSLLLDITSAIVAALSNSVRSYDFQPAESIVTGRLPLELQGTEELCKITFSIKEAESESSSETFLLMLCSELEPAVGEAPSRRADTHGFSSEDISKAILARLQQMGVSVTAQLASVGLTFEGIADLEVGDILLLDNKIDEPVELIVEGQQLFRARPAKSAGKYAVVITQTPFSNTPQGGNTELVMNNERK